MASTACLWRETGRRRKRVQSFCCADAAACVFVGVVALVLLPCALASDHHSTTPAPTSEHKNTLKQCQGVNAEAYCCVTGGGGGWGWLPLFPNEHTWNPGFRGFLYAIALIWTFFGVAILSDAFMAGIEEITGTTKLVKTTDPETGEECETEELVWNPAVANLTLLALGSSAPEIMMSCIEIGASGGHFGAIGAPCVVGSASFNLFVIIGLCMLAIPEEDTRVIEGVQTFCITATVSVLAYIWVCIIVIWSSPNVVTFWEALVTFLMFPALTIVVYLSDTGYINFMCCNGTKVGPDEGDKDKTEGGGEGAEGDTTAAATPGGGAVASIERVSSAASSAMRAPQKSAAVKAHAQMAAYRHAAKGGIMGGGARSDKAGRKMELKEDEDLAESSGLPVFVMETSKISVLETVADGMVKLVVMRLGDSKSAACVDYETKDKTAKAHQHYEHKRGTLEFDAGQDKSELFVKIIHDKQANDDLSFVVNLSLPETSNAKLGHNNTCEVTIIDMDGPGIFTWSEMRVHEHKSRDSRVPLLIERNKGSTGAVMVKVVTVDGTAEAGKHYRALEEEVKFTDNMASKAVRVPLMQFDKPEDAPEVYKLSFFVDLVEMSDAQLANGATLGDVTRVEVEITHEESSEEDQQLTFADQFRQAMAVNGGEDTENATCIDLTTHYISITWKILAAACPPTHIYGGWPTFWVSLIMVGVTTGIIGDIATVFSCVVGLDAETAGIFLVALGTSLPDTFASILAIKHEHNADNAVGNVTGSNSVNVFLGLGMPWLFASIHWWMVWPPGWRDEDPQCIELETCTSSKTGPLWDRQEWLKKYQGLSAGPDSSRPPEYQLLLKYADTSEKKQAQAGFLPEYGGEGGFVVIGGKLGFNTFIFSVLCCVCFLLLAISRCRIGKDSFGGPTGNKVIACCFFTCWAVFLIFGSLNNACDNCMSFIN